MHYNVFRGFLNDEIVDDLYFFLCFSVFFRISLIKIYYVYCPKSNYFLIERKNMYMNA